MFNILFIGVLVLLSVLLGISGLKKWKELNQKSYLIVGIVSILAGLVFVIDVYTGFYILALAVIVRVIGSYLSGKTKGDDGQVQQKDADNEDS